MLQANQLIRFLLFFLLIYGLFLLTSPVGDKLYADYFRSFGRYFFYSFIDKGAVGFVALKNPEQPKFSTEIRLANMKVMNKALDNNTAYQYASIEESSWYTGFLPTILLFSLILATPNISLKRKAVALLWSMLLIHIFIWFQLYVQILYKFEQVEILEVVSRFSPIGQKVMNTLNYLFVESMGIRFIIPVFIWILVTFRKGDLEMLKT